MCLDGLDTLWFSDNRATWGRAQCKNPEKCSAMGFTVVDVKPEKNRVGSYGGHQRYVDAT